VSCFALKTVSFVAVLLLGEESAVFENFVCCFLLHTSETAPKIERAWEQYGGLLGPFNSAYLNSVYFNSPYFSSA